MRFLKSTYSLFLIITLCLFAAGSKAQSKKYLLVQAEKSMKEKDYFSAAQYYNKIILIDSSEISFQYAYAEASRLNYDFDIAFHWYEKAMKKDNGKTYPETSFWLASILKSKGRYKEAKKYFDKYYKKQRNSKDKTRKQFAAKAKQETDACDLAMILIKNPENVVVEHLDSTVNSRVSEYAPFELDSVLYFSSLRDIGNKKDMNNISYNKLYTSKKRQEKWEQAAALDSLFNANNIHNANTAFSDDFSKIFVSRCTAASLIEYTCQIYFSEYRNKQWSELKPLPEPINVAGTNNTQPASGLLNGKNVLFFGSNRGGGEGSMDIWYATYDSLLNFEAPVNLGTKINSTEDEITPWYVKEINTLYFSSTWHKGLGGFDIFKSVYKNNEFSEPVNVGYPINSSHNDIYYSVNSAKNRAYLSSNRIGSYFEEKQNCCNDIYCFSIPPLSEPVKPVDTSRFLIEKMKVLVPLTLYFHNDEPDPRTKAITTKKNYKKTYEDYLSLKPKYQREYTDGLKEEQKEQAENRVNTFFEDSVDAGMHDLDKFAMLLEQVLLRGEKVKITMKGFCSPLASTDYNVNLAKRRITSLRNYFMEYKEGVFVKYVDNKNENEGSILFTEEDIGELPVSKVSDDVKDVKNSVYSPYAAAERKIQIIAISSFTEHR